MGELDEVTECEDCGRALTARYRERYPGRFLCIECVKRNLERIAEEAAVAEQAPKKRRPKERQDERQNPVRDRTEANFCPFTDEEAAKMAEHLEEMMPFMLSLHWKGFEFVSQMKARLIEYRGRTMFSEKQWKYFRDLLGVSGWPKDLNKQGLEYPRYPSS